MRKYWVYILANRRNGTLYIGVTNNITRRVWQHRSKIIKGFTSKHNITRLVYYEETNDIFLALNREKQIKKWNRNWKLELIEANNPLWKDLYSEINPGSPLSRG